MKTFNDYIDAPYSNLLEELGCFYAVGKQQFEEKRKPVVEYFYRADFLFCPKENYKEFLKRSEEIYEQAIKQDIQEKDNRY